MSLHNITSEIQLLGLTNAAAATAGGFPVMQKMVISGGDGDECVNDGLDAFALALVQLAPGLVYLVLKGFMQLTAAVVERLVRKLTRLTKLSLRSCHSNALRRLRLAGQQLRTVEVFCCKALKELNLSACPNVIDLDIATAC